MSSTYKHVQCAPLCLLFYVLGVVFIVLSWNVRNDPGIPWVFAAVGMLMLLLAASFHHLTVQDTGDRLLISFGPIAVLRRTVRYEDICGVEQGRTTVLDGWGIHMSPKGGWVWNIWVRDCVVLRLRERTLRIGTDDADNLTEFLRTKMYPAGFSEEPATRRGDPLE